MRRQFDQPLLPKGIQSEKSVAISAVGDLMNAKGMENSAGKFYANVAELIFEADISIVSLESTLTTANLDPQYQITHYQINATSEQFDALKDHKGRQYTVYCTVFDCKI